MAGDKPAIGFFRKINRSVAVRGERNMPAMSVEATPPGYSLILTDALRRRRAPQAVRGDEPRTGAKADPGAD